MGAASKQKGSAFERLVCTRLSLWVSENASKDLFWRSAMSGGRATVRQKRGERMNVSGDICAVDERGHILTDNYHIECKHLQSLDMTAFVIKSKGALAIAWLKCVAQAKHHGKLPMLIARQNLYPIIVLTDTPRPITASLLHPFTDLYCELRLFDTMLSAPFILPRLRRDGALEFYRLPKEKDHDN